jgi:hypothetical protein
MTDHSRLTAKGVIVDREPYWWIVIHGACTWILTVVRSQPSAVLYGGCSSIKKDARGMTLPYLTMLIQIAIQVVMLISFDNLVLTKDRIPSAY